MKRKISRILGVAVSLAMLTGLMISATPVSGADPLKWGEELSPASYTLCVIGGVIPSTYTATLGPASQDVKDFALAPNGSTVYAALGTFDYPTPPHCFDPYFNDPAKWYLAKSTTAGMMWSWVEVKDEDGDAIVSTSIDLVAVAPDSADGSVVAIVYDGDSVAISEDGGTIWTKLGIPDGSATAAAYKLYSLDVNREVSGKRYIAAGGNTGNATDCDAGLWYFDLGTSVPTWVDITSSEWDNSEFHAAASPSGQAVLELQFSPNYPSDRTMAVITGSVAEAAADDDARLQLASFAGKCWNKDQFGATWESTSGDGQLIMETSDNITAAASISMPTSFIASDDTARVFFVGVSTNSTEQNGGIFRFEDDERFDLDSTNVMSVAYNTDDNLLVAGEYFTNNVLRSDNPTAKEPDLYDSSSFKRPGVNGQTNKVAVTWAGAKVLAGSQGADSAFSVSSDDGKCFNDISMVDHDIGVIQDFAVNASGSKLYVVSEYGGDTMLWRGGSYFWNRVLTLAGGATANYTVRVAPDDDNVVYLAELGSTTIYYSNDGGDTKWMYRYCGTNLVDLAVESADVVYAVDSSGFVTKSTDGGFVWSDKVDTGLDHGATIVSLGEDKVIIGGTKGEVGYSTDGGETWKKMGKVGSGTVQVCADGLDSGSHIYAATDLAGGDYVYRATLPGTTWTKMTDERLDNPCYGIGLSDDGVLYVMTRQTGYSLYSIEGDNTTTQFDWTTANFTGTAFIPGSILVTVLRDDFGVTTLATDNDDPDDEDLSGLCGSTGTVDYATQALSMSFDEAPVDKPLYVTYDILPGNIIIAYNSNSPVYRCLTPTAEEEDVIDAWSTIESPGKEFDSPDPDASSSTPGMGPQALKMTGNKLWAVTKPNGGSSAKLYSLTDSIHIPEEGPPITQPEDGATLLVNPQTGKAYDMIFQWDRPVKTAEAYELEIAYDSAFKATIQTATIESEATTIVVAWGPYSKPTNAETIEYMPGTTYYWRVRVKDPFFSPWSDVRNFMAAPLVAEEVEEEVALEPGILTPSFAAEDVKIKPSFSWTAVPGATYEFVLAEELGLDDPFEIIDYSATSDIAAHIAREDLKYSTTYHWRVRSISDAGTSEWVRGIFTTKAEPAPAAEPVPPVEIKEITPEISLTMPPTEPPVQVIPDYLLWVIVAVGAVLIIAVIVLIVRTRRVT